MMPPFEPARGLFNLTPSERITVRRWLAGVDPVHKPQIRAWAAAIARSIRQTRTRARAVGESVARRLDERIARACGIDPGDPSGDRTAHTQGGTVTIGNDTFNVMDGTFVYRVACTDAEFARAERVTRPPVDVKAWKAESVAGRSSPPRRSVAGIGGTVPGRFKPRRK